MKNFPWFCKDHHVAWQLFVTFHTSALSQIVALYINYLENNQGDSSAANYSYKTVLFHTPRPQYLQVQIFAGIDTFTCGNEAQ